MKIEEITDIYEKISEKADNDFSLFYALDLIWYPLKTSENQRLSDVCRGYKKRSVARNGLISTR